MTERKGSGDRALALVVVLVAIISWAGCVLWIPDADDFEVFNDDGGWCWFEDERAIFQDGHLVFGSVAAGSWDPIRRGSIEVTVHTPSSGVTRVFTLHRGFEYDDHDSPALLATPDGGVLAMYSRHGSENRFFYRISGPLRQEIAWDREREFVVSEDSEVTYSNLHYLARENDGQGRVYNFFRGLDRSYKPSFMFSNDWGVTWTTGSVLVDVPAAVRHRPYVKYASNGQDTVHLAYTEGHPRDFDNSIYHIYYRAGQLFGSDGTRLGSLEEGLQSPSQGTRVFQGDPDNVAWVSDLHLDDSGDPCVVYSVQKDSAGLAGGEGGLDHRYRYARWSGRSWIDSQAGFAGSRLYAGEDDYTGTIALHPKDLNVVFVSSNVSPATGFRLASGHYEIFKGVTMDSGRTWRWAAITSGSDSDNIRPVVTTDDLGASALLWLRGTYRSYTDYELQVVGRVPAP